MRAERRHCGLSTSLACRIRDQTSYGWANKIRICYVIAVTWCEVIFSGSDRQEHKQLVEASILYDAASQALEQVGKLWWFDPLSPLVVRVLERSKEYKLTPRQVHSWKRNGQGAGKSPGVSKA
jgi:hypothetical protein